MKRLILIFGILVSVFALNHCEKPFDPPPPEGKGTLIFKAVGHVLPQKFVLPYNPGGILKHKKNDHWMHTLNLMLNVREVWVSQQEVKEGVKDTFEWIKIGEGNSMKYFDEYYFENYNMPTGTYKSIKILFNELFYRQANFVSDTSRKLLMKERMGDWKDTTSPPCADISKTAPMNYFSQHGNFSVSTGGYFSLVNKNETITGFNIQSGKQTKLYWKMGDERPLNPYDCRFLWIDENKNDIWDCGIDRMDSFQCNVDPPLRAMWMFIPE